MNVISLFVEQIFLVFVMLVDTKPSLPEDIFVPGSKTATATKDEDEPQPPEPFEFNPDK